MLGNHELNILFGSRKEGNGWIRADTSDHYQFKDGDVIRQEPFDSVPATPTQAEDIIAFFKTLPLVLQRDDLRVVHACWHPDGIARLPEEAEVAVSSAARGPSRFTGTTRLAASGLRRRRSARPSPTSRGSMSDPPGISRPCGGGRGTPESPSHQGGHQRPGSSRSFENIFFVGGKWRFVKRLTGGPTTMRSPQSWWGTTGAVATAWVEGKPDPWATDHYAGWSGPRKNVFCVDYSVGRRFLERARGSTGPFEGGLAALRWPERTLVFDDREGEFPTV